MQQTSTKRLNTNRYDWVGNVTHWELYTVYILSQRKWPSASAFWHLYDKKSNLKNTVGTNMDLTWPADCSDLTFLDAHLAQGQSAVLQVSWPLQLPSQGLVSNKDYVLKHYEMPLMANRRPHCRGRILPLCRGAVVVFFSPYRQGGKWEQSTLMDWMGTSCKS